jgi:hypothetical protein
MGKVKAPGNPITALGQDTRTTCWYTCYRMMYIWKGLTDPGTVTKSTDAAGNVTYNGGGDIKAKLTANDDKGQPIIDWFDACKSGLKAKDYHKAGRALGLQSRACGTGLSLNDLQDMLKYSPVWVAGNWQGFNHNVLVVESTDTEITFADPWSDTGIPDTETNKVEFFLYGNNPKRDSYGNVTGPGNPQGAYYHRGWFQFQRW